MAAAWKVVGASVAGFSHIDDGTPCQDAHACSELEHGWFVGITSDGAGSAARSEHGSRTLCESLHTFLTTYIAEVIQLGRSVSLDEAEMRNVIVQGIALIRETLLGQMPESALSDFHATLVGVIAGPDDGLFFHIGDGVAVATDSDAFSSLVVSLPENGEYANETYFFTQPDWQSHLRLTRFGKEHDLIVLMSDGVSPFAMGPGGKEPHLPFLKPLSAYFNANDVPASHVALVNTLQSDRIRPITGDDKTLLWAKRVSVDDQLHD